MLTGAKIILYTDHKNLTFKTFSVQRILRWRLFLDQFYCQIKYIEGKENVPADCFSRLPRMEKPLVGDREAQGKGHLINSKDIKLPKDNEGILDGETLFQEALEECLLNLPTLTTGENPTTIRNITNHQE